MMTDSRSLCLCLLSFHTLSSLFITVLWRVTVPAEFTSKTFGDFSKVVELAGGGGSFAFRLDSVQTRNQSSFPCTPPSASHLPPPALKSY